MGEEELAEVRRSRWRRARQRLGLGDPGDVHFGSTGFGKHLGTPAVRLLILPVDPEVNIVDFDDEFWGWWRRAQPDPAAGGTLLWGTHRYSSIQEAAVVQSFQGDWDRYLAVERSGGLDMGLGADPRYGGGPYSLQLLKIVGRIWSTLTAYTAVIDRYSAQGPWQLALALIGVSDSELGLFAAGWEQDRAGQAQLPMDANQLHLHEIADWPRSPDDVRDQAFRLGAVFEDAWGFDARRFLTVGGDNPGKFDTARYRQL